MAGPIFVVTAARSGSTLLRYLLRAHPSVYCPAETNLPVAFSAIFTAHAVSSGNPPAAAHWEPAAIETCRIVGERTMTAAAAGFGKARWCDKSLITAMHAELVVKVYPDAALLVLYRRCRDFIESALEACPWGLAGFGFDAYARDHPGNSVLALTRYWLDRVAGQLAVEEQHGANTYRVTYEDLVVDTAATLGSICAFVGLDFDASYFDDARVFDAPPTFGPEDQKISYTYQVSTESVGRGAVLPLEDLIPPDLMRTVEEYEAKLYPSASREQPADASSSYDSARRRDSLREILSAVSERFARAGSDRLNGLSASGQDMTLTVIVDDGTESVAMGLEAGRLVDAPEPSALRLRAAPEVMAALLDGRIAPIVAQQRRLVIPEMPDGSEPEQREAYAALRAFLRVVADRSIADASTSRALAAAIDAATPTLQSVA